MKKNKNTNENNKNMNTDDIETRKDTQEILKNNDN